MQKNAKTKLAKWILLKKNKCEKQKGVKFLLYLCFHRESSEHGRVDFLLCWSAWNVFSFLITALQLCFGETFLP